MKVQDVMTTPVATCKASDNAATCIRLMFEHNCGCCPIVDENNHVVGIVTDRDLCLALGQRDRRPSEVRIGDIMSRNVQCCRLDDSVDSCLRVMANARVRRLPVIDASDCITGIVSISDFVIRTDLVQQTMEAMRSICEHIEEARAPDLARSK